MVLGVFRCFGGGRGSDDFGGVLGWFCDDGGSETELTVVEKIKLLHTWWWRG